MRNHLPDRKPSDFLIYQAEDGRTRIEVRVDANTVWLPQAAMADLFQTTKQNVSLHLRNILGDKELEQESVVNEYLTTAADGKGYTVLHYNLDDFLRLSGRELLSHAGNVSHEDAIVKARQEYDQYRAAHLNDAWPVEDRFLKTAADIRRLGGKKS